MQTVGDLPINDAHLQHLLTNPLVLHCIMDLTADFKVAFKELLDRPVADEEVEAMTNLKTDTFQSFITGCLWARNPEGQFCRVISRLSEPKSKLIL